MKSFAFLAKSTLLLIFVIAAFNSGNAQPGGYKWDRFGLGNVDMTNNSPASGIISNTTQATSANTYYLVQWDDYWNKWSNTSTPFNQEFTLTWGGGNKNGADGALSTATVTNKYYTLQVRDLSYSNRQAVLMETDNSPQSFHATASTAVSIPIQRYPGQDATITLTLAGNKSAQEKVFVRYTNNNWSTSKVVEASGTGSTWSTATATIPATDNTTGATIKYYAQLPFRQQIHLIMI